MDRAVFATEPTARYASGLQQQLRCKHHDPNGNRETGAIGGLPNSHVSQPKYIRFSLRSLGLLGTKFPVLHPTSSPPCTTCWVRGGAGRETEIVGPHSPRIENGREESPKWFREMYRPKQALMVVIGYILLFVCRWNRSTLLCSQRIARKDLGKN